MSSTQDRKKTLLEHRVVPDVLPEQVNLSYDLTVRWSNTTLDTPGAQLDREETQPKPQVYLNPPPSETLDNLVLIVVDPDLLMNDDTYFGQVRHWLVTNLSSNPDGSLNYSDAVETSPYVGPAPLPNYLYSRSHRYVFILAQGTGKVEVKPEDLREQQQQYMAVIAGKQSEVQDIKDRWGFNTRQLIEQKGLKVEAVNFMRVEGTLNGAVDNAVMMGQGMINKVLGN